MAHNGFVAIFLLVAIMFGSMYVGGLIGRVVGGTIRFIFLLPLRMLRVVPPRHR